MTGILPAMLIFCFMSGCAGAEPIQSGEHPDVKLSAWTVDWDTENSLSEYNKIKKNLDAVSVFRAYYDAKDELIVPDEVKTMVKKIGKKKTLYLSFTNDIQLASGKSVEKDKEILGRLLKDDAARDAQAELMVRTAKELGFDGVELDYEAFWKEPALRDSYIVFVTKLYTTCRQNDLKLRVVLEPSALKLLEDDNLLVKGPDYIVMLYNLYGKHSGPGPKADGAFIKKTISAMSKLPGNKGVALSTGGCIWEDYALFGLISGNRKFITEQEAVSLRDRHHAVEERDAESAAMHFTYQDNGKDIEIWYADAETINAWITVAANEGITDISIWRLGNNVDIKDVKGRL